MTLKGHARAGRALLLHVSASCMDTESISGLRHELGPCLEVLQPWFVKRLCQIRKLGF